MGVTLNNMKYIIYQITNIIDGKTYIGCHKTDNLDDDYMGSGKYLKRAIEKHGIENFQKDILCVFDTSEEMFDMESVLVNEEFVKRSDTYNLKEGGYGGWDSLNRNKNNLYYDDSGKCINGNPENFLHGHDLMDLLKKRGTYDNFVKKRSDVQKGNTNWLGKRHSNESKRKIGEANSKHQSGSGNSQYGKCWIFHPELKENKSIDKTLLDEYTQQGWIKGRKIKT